MHRFSTSKKYQNHVNGEWVDFEGPQINYVTNPATQDVVGSVHQTSKEDFDKIVANSLETFKTWKEVPLPQKVRMMLRY